MTAESKLTYDPVAHIYRVNGSQRIGLTRLLAAEGYYKGSHFYTDGRREYGRAVHSVAAALDQYAPEVTEWEEAAGIFRSLSPDLILDGRAWLLFKRETGFRAKQQWEEPLFSEELQVAGTPDVVGMADGRLTIVDAKAWRNAGQKPQRSAEVQLAGYGIMVAEKMALPVADIQRWIVRLSGNGRYRLYRCENRADYAIVRALACVFHDKLAAGLVSISGEPEETEGEN